MEDIPQTPQELPINEDIDMVSSQPNLQSQQLPQRPEIASAAEASPTSFRDSTIAIAVDVSGSTAGAFLEAEKRAVRSICSLFPPSTQTKIKILPWSDGAGEEKAPKQLDSLLSYGGTDPNVLIQHDGHRKSLQQSSFWFLMTDGIIEADDVRIFAQGILQNGLHGRACVISIFGCADERPSKCNITVGLSVFAVSPHTAFLYTQVGTKKTYVLQTKGCFSALLPPGHPNPSLDYDTDWSELPQISYENLSRVTVPGPCDVTMDEIILNTGMNLDVNRLLQELPTDEEIIGPILDNDDNLKSVVLTAKVRGQSDKVRTWMDKIDQRLRGHEPERQIADEQHSQLLADVISNLSKPSSRPLKSAQQPLQEVNEIERTSYAKRSETAFRRKSGCTYARRISSGGYADAGDNIGNSQCSIPEASPSAQLFNPGFLKPEHRKDYYIGKCGLCGVETGVMALLLRQPPSILHTDHLPPPYAHARLNYPLTMGNYAETDVVASQAVCDPCSSRLVRTGQSLGGELLVSALPLVSFIQNKEAWLETISVATEKRFHKSNIPLVFLAILYTKMERLLGKEETSEREELRQALQWTCNTLLSEVLLVRTGDAMLDCFGVGALHDVLLRNFRNVLEGISKTALLEYPLDGFIVANVALSNSQHSKNITGSRRKKVVFLRFLYYLTERYYQYGQQNEDLVVEAAKGLLLSLSDPVGPRSLLQWEKLSMLSGRWESMEELRQHLRRMSKRPPSFKLSITVKELTDSPFFSAEAVSSFQRLGILFSWISSQANHATAVFVHYLLRKDYAGLGVQDRFLELCKEPAIKEALEEPSALSARRVEELIKHLPPLQQQG